MDEGQKKLFYLFERPYEPLDVPRKGGQMVYQMEGEENREWSGTRFGGDRGGPEPAMVPVMAEVVDEAQRIENLIKKGIPFSQFNPRHREAAGMLNQLFMREGSESAEKLADVAANVKDHVNEGLFIYALTFAITRNPDLDSRMIPPIFEIFPNKFITQDTFDEAEAKLRAMQYENSEETEVMVPQDVFSTGTDFNPEHRVAYFREDYGLNAHHWHWHVIFPVGPMDPQKFTRDRKGEIFFYMHNQMMARYDWERLSNRLNRVVKYDNWREPIPEGYFPKLTINNSRTQYGGRPDNMTPQNFTRIDKVDDPLPFGPFDINDMERWRQRLFDAIHQGFMINEHGDRVRLTDDPRRGEKRGIDILGDTLEADELLSVNRTFYGSLHNFGHDMIAFIHDPHGYHKEDLGTIGDTSTSCRDPAFWRWHKFVDDVFVEYKMQQKPYEDDELVFNPVQVESVVLKTNDLDEENVLETYFKYKAVQAYRGLDFRAVNSNNEGINVTVNLQHLTHKPFTYNIQVTNNDDEAVEVTVRIYMAPKLNVADKKMTFMEQRLLWAEMDKFHFTLASGDNTIERSSEESSITIPEELTFQDLENYTPEVSSYCGCGWPQHLLLPKGKAEGMEFEILVLLSDWNKDKVDDSAGEKKCSNAASFCGIQNKKYPDARPMGYPFDRRPNQEVNGVEIKNFANYAEALPNAVMSDVKIFFRGVQMETPNENRSMREIVFPS